MEKEIVLSRLQSTIDNLKKLNPKRFNYSNFVNEGLVRGGNICGTVCCVAGWYPRWYGEESGLKYTHIDEVSLTTLDNKISAEDISEVLVKYHDIRSSLIEILFYGQTMHSPWSIELVQFDKQYPGFFTFFPGDDKFSLRVPFGLSSTLEEVTKMFELVYELIQNDLINYKPL